MPWRHRRTPLTMSDASGNRLPKSGKIMVTSVDLKVQDAKTKRFRTFRPTFEVADLEIDEMVILGYDWFSETTERIVVGPPCKSTVFYRTSAPIIVYHFPYITCLFDLLFLIKHVRTSE